MTGSDDWFVQKLARPTGDLHIRYMGRGPTLIALHGIQGTADVWTAVAQELSPEYTFVAPDMRGRAPSMIPPSRDEYAMSHFAADLEALVAETGSPAQLIGWSMGVLVLLEYFRRGGPAPKALALIAGTACFDEETRWFHSHGGDDTAAEAAQRAARLGLTRAADPQAVAASWWHARRCDYRDVLGTVGSPTLILHGDQDDQCPPHTAVLLEHAIPRVERETWEGCGHNPMAHDAQRFADTLRRFIQRQQGEAPVPVR